MFILVAVMSVMSWTLRQQSDYTTLAVDATRLGSERASSDLEVTSVHIDNDKFNITLQNNGPLTEKIVRLWVTNETTTDFHNNYDIDYIAGPKQVVTGIGQNIPLTVNSTNAYAFKFVTERGNLLNFRSLSVAQADLGLSMYIIPSTISTGENVTVIMSVSNNVREVDSIRNLEPIMNTISTCSSDCPVVVEQTTPNDLDSLSRGSMALFKWTYNVQGSAGSKVTFNGTLAGAKQGIFASDDVNIITISQSLESLHSINATIAESIGSIRLEHDSLRFFFTTGDSQSGVNVDGYPAFASPTGEYLMWSVNLTNNDPQKRNLTLSSLSFLQTSGTQGVKHWYICDGLMNPPIPGKVQPYNTTKPKVVLDYTITTTVYFGSASPESDGAEANPSVGMEGIFVILSGAFDDGRPYGQTIPFEATYVNPGAITLSTESGGDGASINLSGTDFKINSNVDLLWIYSDGTTTNLNSVTSDSSGIINTSFTVPSGQPGYYVIYATDSINTAFATVQHL